MTSNHHPATEAAMPGTMFIAIWEGDTEEGEAGPEGNRPAAMTEQEVSRMFDMADCDYTDGLVELLAIGNDGRLHPVTTGKSRRTDTDDERPGAYFATAPLLTDDGRNVGTVHFTDH